MLPLHGQNTAAVKFSLGRNYLLYKSKGYVFAKQLDYLFAEFLIKILIINYYVYASFKNTNINIITIIKKNI